MSEITIKIEVTDQQCADIMCTALEGGIGYWCAASNIVRSKRDAKGDWNYIEFKANPDDEGEGDFEPTPVSYDVIRLGIERILSGATKIRSDLREQVLSVTNPDHTGIDADAADCIVQAAIFNTLVYG